MRRFHALIRLLVAAAAGGGTAAALWAAVDANQFLLVVTIVLAVLIRVQGHSEAAAQFGAALLVVAVAAVVGTVSGPTGPLFIALLLVMVDLAQTVRASMLFLIGVLAAAVVAAVAVVVHGQAAIDDSWMWPLLLVPMGGFVARRIGSTQPVEGTAALESVRAALDEVVRLAERMPAGFDRWSVARAVRAELLEASGREADAEHLPHLFLCDNGVLFGVGTPWRRRAVGLVGDVPVQQWGRSWRPVAGPDLPASMAGVLGEGRWLAHRLVGAGGHVVVIPSGLERRALEAVEHVLHPAAVAMANVERFERLQEIATDAARVRVAHDLHDGVAQALTHVRFELDLLGLHNGAVLEDAQRIRAVADAALSEVRRTVDELREAVPLKERLERHVDLLRSFVPATIELDMPPSVELDPDVADDVFRIVQEAVTNAIRHADAATIGIAMSTDVAAGSVTVVVADDGKGVHGSLRHGVGLDGMHRRVQRFGGELLIRARVGGGTVVEFEAPGSSSADTTGGGSPSDSHLTTPKRHR